MYIFIHLHQYFTIVPFQDFNAKVSDFGFAKDAPVGNKNHVSTEVMGTEGYIAPEYVLTG